MQSTSLLLGGKSHRTKSLSNELPLLQRDPTAYCEKATSISLESSLQEFVERLSCGSDLKPLIQPLLSSSLKGERRTQQKKLIVWIADLPVGPAADARHVLEALGVQWVERAGEAFCPKSRSSLEALDYSPWNSPSREAIAALAEQLSSDRELQRADAVFVLLPTPANVEFFARFNGSLILVLATRYEEGRYKTARWTALDQLLRCCTATRETSSSPTTATTPSTSGVLQASSCKSSYRPLVSAAMWAPHTVRRRKASRSRHSAADSTETSLAC